MENLGPSVSRHLRLDEVQRLRRVSGPCRYSVENVRADTGLGNLQELSSYNYPSRTRSTILQTIGETLTPSGNPPCIRTWFCCSDVNI